MSACMMVLFWKIKWFCSTDDDVAGSKDNDNDSSGLVMLRIIKSFLNGKHDNKFGLFPRIETKDGFQDIPREPELDRNEPNRFDLQPQLIDQKLWLIQTAWF